VTRRSAASYQREIRALKVKLSQAPGYLVLTTDEVRHLVATDDARVKFDEDYAAARVAVKRKLRAFLNGGG
jgi:hypothetical protein